MIDIVQIETPEQIEAVRALVREFTEFALTQDPNAKNADAFKGLEEQLAALPGIFGPPDGAFLLASVEGAPAGCLAMRRVDDAVCEVKRMYVRPAFRGHRLGQLLLDQVLATARARGYGRIVLDSFHTLTAAHAIYRANGFRDCPPTFDLPEMYRGKIVFMEMDL